MGDEDKNCLYDHGCHGQPWLKMLTIAPPAGPALFTEWMLSQCHSIDWFPVLPSTSLPGSCPFGISFHPYLHVFAEITVTMTLVSPEPPAKWIAYCTLGKQSVFRGNAIYEFSVGPRFVRGDLNYSFKMFSHTTVSMVEEAWLGTMSCEWVLCGKLPSGSYVWRSNPKSSQKRKPPVSVLCEALLSMLQCQLQQPSFVCY